MQPTWESTIPPSLSPTHSVRPTAFTVQSESEPGKVFRVNYLYGAAAVLVVGLAVMAFFQSRTSNLIKERHDVALEIADTNY